MKKRLLCLFLGLVMVLSVALTACSTEEEEEADVDVANAQTITMRLISEREVCNTEEELAAYLQNQCGGDKESQKYKDMVSTKAAYDAVEAAFTKITKSKFKVNVDLIFYTEDNYYDFLDETINTYASEMQNAELAERALEKYIEDYQAAFPEANYPEKRLEKEFYKYFPEYEKYKDQISVAEEEEDEDGENKVVEDQYKENADGIKELVYPATQPNQLDIVYISGMDMYNDYIENEYLQDLNEYLKTTGKKLNDYITSALLDGVQVDGMTYAIPNNVQIGEYTYMLVDADLLDRYYHNKEDIHDLLDLKSFLQDVSESEPGVLPIDASFAECMNQYVWYWNLDWEEDEETGNNVYSIPNLSDLSRNEFSLFGAVYGDPATAGRGQISLGFENLFTLPEYRDIFLGLKEFEFNKYYKAENDTRTDAAITFMTGTYEIKDSIDKEIEKNGGNHTAGIYTDENGKRYYTYVVKYPEVDEESLYGNMYGVSTNSTRTQACVQVLTLLNTNSELRNLLQYGIENINYVINEDTGMLERLNDTYLMDINKTGNCFIAHPEEGQPADYWEFSKKQNNDALIHPLLGFDFNDRLEESGSDLDTELWKLQKTYCEDVVLAKINDCGDFEELYELIANETTGFGVTLLKDPSILLEGDKNPRLVRLSKLSDSLYDVTSSMGEGPDGPIVDENGESPYAVYYNWMSDYNFLPKE